MTNEQAYVVLENCASLLDSGTRFFTEDHTKQFHEAYELAMEALRKTERKRGRWIRTVLGATSGYGTTVMYQCSKCGKMAMSEYHYCPNCGANI